jgi:hypothetical protein
MYLDNFVNDVNDAWLSNDRVFVFEYENGAVLKIGYADILKLLNVPSELNPQPTEAELGKKYKIPPDLGACPFSHFGRPRREYNSPKSAIRSRHFHRSR